MFYVEWKSVRLELLTSIRTLVPDEVAQCYILLFTGPSQTVDSVIYKWSKTERRFREHQIIPTVGAYDWTFFTVDSFRFLAVAQAFNGLTTLIDSKIFVLQNNEFIFFQALEVHLYYIRMFYICPFSCVSTCLKYKRVFKEEHLPLNVSTVQFLFVLLIHKT